MIKDETKKLIDKAIEIELQNALEQKEFADTHHAYTKEFEEVVRIFDSCSKFQNYIVADVFRHALRNFWSAAKDNGNKQIKYDLEYDLDQVLKCAKKIMAEFVQVAAVCKKAQQQLFGKEEKNKIIKDETKALIDKVVDIELQNILECGKFADAHHTYTKEFEEVIRIFHNCFIFQNYIADVFRHALQNFWSVAKDNDKKRIKYDLDKVLKCVKKAMAEFVQVAAVCKKARQRFFGKEKKSKMIKDETKALINKVVDIKLQNILECGEFADAHHTYTKEFEEVIRIFHNCFIFQNYITDVFFYALRYFWFAVKDNNDERIKYDLDKVLKCVKKAMDELAQIAAVCEKAQQ